MQDRVSLYPGRVKLEPVAGQANLYDLTRADQPTQEGTPLNKASLLKDATAALFGLTTDAVPDNVLSVLSRFQKGLGNEYVWAKSDGTFVNSPYPNAYPPAVSDGYTYKLLGKVAESMRFEIGNYVGTGGYYKGRGPHLIFNIKPKLLVITTTEITNNYTYAYQPQVINFEASKYAHDEAIKKYGTYSYLQLSTFGFYTIGDNPTTWYGEIITDNEIKWFIQSGDATKAYNVSGKTYHYLAIG